MPLVFKNEYRFQFNQLTMWSQIINMLEPGKLIAVPINS